jgi:hypothetical protein
LIQDCLETSKQIAVEKRTAKNRKETIMQQPLNCFIKSTLLTVGFFIATAIPSAAQTMITRLEPASQNPGRTVTLIGQGFCAGMRVNFFYRDSHPSAATDRVRTATATVINERTARVTVPINILPGRQRLSVSCGRVSPEVDFTARPFRYSIVVKSLRCNQETSDTTPRSVFSGVGSDDIVTVWTVLSDLRDDRSRRTGEYAMDAGDLKLYQAPDHVAFPAPGEPAGFYRYLYLGISLFEWDGGRVHPIFNISSGASRLTLNYDNLKSSANQKTLSDYSQAIHQGWMRGDREFLGYRSILWSPIDLQNLTNNPTRSFDSTFSYSGGGGSYTVTYNVTRIDEP